MIYFFGFLGLYFMLLLGVHYFQESFIFYPSVLDDTHEFSDFKDIEERFFEPEAGVRLHALHFKVKNSRGLVLYFHGNARALDNWGYAAADFTSRGYEVLMPDYRGYGKSKGKRSEAALFSDALYIYGKIRLEVPDNQIIIYGRSLGSGIATKVATQNHPRLLILETPFYSILRLARESMPFLPVKYLLSYHFRTDENIQQINCPVYLLHGTEDELIPYQHALDLKDHYPAAHLYTFPGAKHNNLSDFPLFHQLLDQLLLTDE